jgi:hypothetical protein
MRRSLFVFLLAIASACQWTGWTHASEPIVPEAPACHETARSRGDEADSCLVRCLQSGRQIDTASASRAPETMQATVPEYFRPASVSLHGRANRRSGRIVGPEPPPGTGDARHVFDVRRRI